MNEPRASRRIGNLRLLKLARILDVADANHCKRGEPTYDQSQLYHGCGTPACAGGHWDESAAGKKLGGASQIWGHTFALKPDERQEIFGQHGCGQAQTAAQAARYIRKFVAKRRASK